VVVMVEARMRTVNHLIENGCREDIAILKDITICETKDESLRRSLH
jgi:hypothetical protein